MNHKRPRGHSNLYAEETQPWKDLPEKANIPMSGGSTVYSCKALPPLALSKEEWEMIGLKMGWIKPKRTAIKKN